MFPIEDRYTFLMSTSPLENSTFHSKDFHNFWKAMKLVTCDLQNKKTRVTSISV